MAGRRRQQQPRRHPVKCRRARGGEPDENIPVACSACDAAPSTSKATAKKDEEEEDIIEIEGDDREPNWEFNELEPYHQCPTESRDPVPQASEEISCCESTKMEKQFNGWNTEDDLNEENSSVFIYPFDASQFVKMGDQSQNVTPTNEQPTQIEKQIVEINAQLDTALNSSTLTIERVSEVMPEFLGALREGATKYRCLSDLVTAVRPLLIERPELAMTRRQLKLINDYVEVVQNAFTSVEEKAIDFEHSLTGNLQQLVSITNLYRNALQKLDELRNSPQKTTICPICQKTPAERKETAIPLEVISLIDDEPVRRPSKPSTPTVVEEVTERKETTISSEVISLIDDEPVRRPSKPSTPTVVEETVNPLSETSTSTPKRVEKVFGLKESPESLVKPVSVVLTKLKTPEVKSRPLRTSPAGILKQQKLVELVAKCLAISAKKSIALKKQAEVPVAKDITPIPEPDLFKPDSVVQQYVKKKKTLISSTKAKAVVASSPVESKPALSVSAPVKRVLRNIEAVAPSKKLKASETTTSSVSYRSETVTKSSAEMRLEEVLDKAPSRYCGEDFIPLDVQSKSITVDARQAIQRTGIIRIKPESNVSFSESSIARNSPVVQRRGSRSGSSSTSSTRSDELDEAIELVSAHRLRDKLYMFEKIGSREFNVIMKDAENRIVEKR
ncbi:hypothetical protein V9T40_011979 [Parthenolecanium corni]|uniref:Uncharacterized protein n=1 Tax=Parthenolecanium corni TaxID=536013 RepID=A0AAN9TAB0_9HEMI